MRGRLVTIAAWLVIIICAFIVAARVHSHYNQPDAPGPLVYTPAPLVPNASATASSTAESSNSYSPASTATTSGGANLHQPASATTASPRRTVTTWVTVTATGG